MTKLILADCLDAMRDMDDESVDTIITDPPYGLGFMGKGWDTFKPEEIKRQESMRKPQNRKRNGRATYTGEYDYSRNREFQAWFTNWAKLALRVAKPGSMMLIFGGTRTFHRLTCAIEDAGWEIRDCMMWLYGSGFPKSYNFGKNNGSEWNGYGTALKPAWEPIIVAMKPIDGTFTENAEKHGVAGLNIDGGRIGTSKNIPASVSSAKQFSGRWSPNNKETGAESGHDATQGRWPANVLLDEEAAAMLDEQSGERPTCKVNQIGMGDNHKDRIASMRGLGSKLTTAYGDSGGASRFFYCAKASRSERGNSNNHPTVKPLKLMEYLCKLTRTPEGGVVLDPFMGSGTTGIACINTDREFIGIENNEEYFKIAEARIKHAEEKRGVLV